MNILIDIGHPAHVHNFKNIAKILEKHGHKVFWTCRDIPMVKHLLDSYGYNYTTIGHKAKSKIGKAINVLSQDLRMLFFVHKNKIDFGLSSGIVLPHVSLLSKMKAFVFDDDDDSVEPLVVKYAHPFADAVFTPDVIDRKSANKILYHSIHEWFYLNPQYFQPNEDVLSLAGLKKGEKYSVVRFVAFNGHHDYGEEGLSHLQKRKLIDSLSKLGKVIITSEKELEPEFEQYRMKIAPEHIHSLLYYSYLFVGDSQTMTTEAALLGTPAIKCNTFAGRLAVPNMLEKEYNLCYSYLPTEFDDFINKINEIIETENIKEEWNRRLIKLQDDMIDNVKMVVDYIENYP